jgi:predicted permease
MLADVRLAFRGLLAQPGFSVVVILTLGLGIGANTAIFSAVHALLLRPLPFAEPERLVRISTMRGGQEGGLAVPEQDDLAALDDVIADIALYTDQGMYNASGFGAPEELQATIATHNLFRVLGVDPLIGTVYPAETDRTRRFELLISHGLWTRRFGQDPEVIGRTMTLDGAPGYVIHGVLPPGITFPTDSDLFRSAGISPDPTHYARRDVRGFMAVARLEPGVTVAQARGRLEALGRRLAEAHPVTNAGLQFHVLPLRDLYVGDVRGHVLLLFAAVGLVMLVACANVVNLLLSRTVARLRERAVRRALGATRWHVARQALVEGLVLATLGGLAGWGLAWVGVHVITGLVHAALPPWMSMALDRTTLGFLLAISVGVGVMAGLIPALRDDGPGVVEALKAGTRAVSAGPRHERLRHALVVVEVALALVLLVGASLVVRSFLRLQDEEPGFRPDRLLTFRVELGWRAYSSHEAVIGFHDRVLDRLRALPGVEAVAIDHNLPLSGRPRDPVEIVADGQSLEAQQENPFVHLHLVTEGYFDVIGIPIARGRGFERSDEASGQPVAVVSRRLAERLWPGIDPIGRQITTRRRGPDDPAWTVVGVADDIRHQRLEAIDLDIYRPLRQERTGGAYYVVRTVPGVDPWQLTRPATSIVGDIDADQSYFDVRTMADRVAAGVWQQRLSGVLFVGFGTLALTLAAIGLYGVLSYLVTHQWRDIGVRMALGASTGDVLSLVLGRGLWLCGLGIGVGLVVAWAAARTARHLLYDIGPTDPLTFVGVPVLLAAVGALACWVPARRATRVDPVVALRAE